MKLEALFIVVSALEISGQGGGLNNLRIPNIFANNGNSGFSFSNLFRPSNGNRPQRQQKPQDDKSNPTPLPFLSAPAPVFQPQGSGALPPQGAGQQSLPPFLGPAPLLPQIPANQPVITNPQAVVPHQPLPLERPRQLAPAPLPVQPAPFQPQQPPPVFVQSPPGPPPPLFPQQPQFQPQQPPVAPPQHQQPRPERGFTPVATQIGTAIVKHLPSPIENEIPIRPELAHQPLPDSFKSNQRPSLKEKTYLDCGPGNDLGFCAVSDRYPGIHIDKLMEKCRPEVRKMYAEVPDDPDTLAEVVVPSSILKNLSKARDVEAPSWSWAAYKKESACDSERRTILPGMAKDKTGKWMVIVQTKDMPQRIHMEVCRNPDGACRVMSDCGKKSRCSQRYSWHLLIAMDQDEPDSCPRMAAFRFPTACLCHIELDKPRLIRAHPMSKKMDNLNNEDYEIIDSEESLRADL